MIFKAWRFWRFCIILLFTSFIYFLLQTTSRVIGIQIEVKTFYLQLLGILSLVVLCIFTPLWGLVSDKIKFQYLLFAFNIGTTFVSIIYYYCLKFTVTYFIITLFIFSWLWSICHANPTFDKSIRNEIHYRNRRGYDDINRTKLRIKFRICVHCSDIYL